MNGREYARGGRAMKEVKNSNEDLELGIQSAIQCVLQAVHAQLQMLIPLRI